MSRKSIESAKDYESSEDKIFMLIRPSAASNKVEMTFQAEVTEIGDLLPEMWKSIIAAFSIIIFMIVSIAILLLCFMKTPEQMVAERREERLK